jgi:hypothetical protein
MLVDLVDMLSSVRFFQVKWTAFAVIAGLFVTLSGCRKEEQAVTKVATSAVAVEHQAQAASLKRDEQRAELAKIALPTKSRYVDVHEPGAWLNPFISFDTQMVNLRVTQADANPSEIGKGGILRPTSARRQEIQIHQQDLVEALIALPPGTWPYGRVVAIEESPLADKRQRPMIRRQIETAIRQLNDLGVVVEDWPER